MSEERNYQQLFSAAVPAKWHSIYVDVIKNDRGRWLQITETRPKGQRQSVLIDGDRCEDFERELLKAVSVVGARTDIAHSASAVRARAYEPWTSEEDQVLRFLFRSGAGLAQIAAALQRDRGAIRSRLKHLEVEVSEA